MASSATETHRKAGQVGIIEVDIVADDSDGSVDDYELTTKISGDLLALETNPGATAPQDNYDITCEDQEGHDVLEGVGADRSTSATQKAPIVYSGTGVHPVVAQSDTLTLKVANNNVSSAIIKARIYYRGDFLS